MPVFRYRVHGLSISSDIELPELNPDALHGRGVDVAIHDVGSLPEPASGDVPIAIAEVADFLIRSGSDVYVSRVANAPAPNVRLYLLGSVMGAVLHQRGMLPLHSNAIVIAGKAVAFAGASGAGKSTLAAWAYDQGFEVLADDVSVIEGSGSGLTILPGLRRLRLWRDALLRSGRDPADYPPSYCGVDKAEFDKFDLRLQGDGTDDALPLAAIVILDDNAPGIRRLSPIEATEALFAQTYRGYLVVEVGHSDRHFRRCVDIVEHTPIFEVAMPRDLSRYDRNVSRLFDGLAQWIATSAATDPVFHVDQPVSGGCSPEEM